jgi:D-glycero-D-manno-heptose 1,7-bisphosphate phosphatase
MKKAVFLDRDGVINKKPAEHDYVKSWKEFTLLEGVVDALKLFKKLGYITVVVTNQAGIAKGLMKEKDLLVIHAKLNKLLHKSGVKIDHFYYCPHKPSDNCSCRKPKPGLIKRAVKDLSIDLEKSILIGDTSSDKGLGENANVKTVIVTTDGNLYKSILAKKIASYHLGYPKL